ncbi:MAG: hypothetical protein WKF36_03570 [Candidatus Nitrosocosmicus sp.]
MQPNQAKSNQKDFSQYNRHKEHNLGTKVTKPPHVFLIPKQPKKQRRLIAPYCTRNDGWQTEIDGNR